MQALATAALAAGAWLGHAVTEAQEPLLTQALNVMLGWGGLDPSTPPPYELLLLSMGRLLWSTYEPLSKLKKWELRKATGATVAVLDTNSELAISLDQLNMRSSS